MEALVSLIVPIYNAEKYLETCLDSIKYQSYSKLECILINDASTDRSAEICRKYCRLDSRFLFWDEKSGGGVSFARNEGLKQVSGDYVCFVDADDVLEHDFVFKLLNSLEVSNADFIQCHYTRTEIELGNNQGETGEKFFSPEEIWEDVLMFNKVMPVVWGKLFRKKALEEVRFNEECTVLEDVEFLTKLMKSKVMMIDMQYIGYYYRMTPGSLISQGINLNKLNGSIFCHNSCIDILAGTDKENTAFDFKEISLFNWLIRASQEKVWKEISGRIKLESKKDLKKMSLTKIFRSYRKIILLINILCPTLAHVICKSIKNFSGEK